ncbi:hypothetical protein K7X08_012097 [Anisodus acutangulus]|uniref:Uncharacterized protein n=1 Tax=Anisodus acutangulus TaxID=402998 RepID=A0A9Q1L9F8_9SOLA|nr:hypothetical protein K7X08_012097 [Anisodus acutangulus]
MVAEQKLHLTILLFIYLPVCSSQFALSQLLWDYNTSLLNSTAGISSFWINRPSLIANSTDFFVLTPILKRENAGARFLCGFCCNDNATECFLGILLYHSRSDGQIMINKPQLVWSANRNHPVKTNATFQLGQDGSLVLTDSDNTIVWSTNTTGKSVSGLNLTEMGNLVLFDKRKRAIWQSFDHPTDSLLPGQTLVSGRKLTATNSSTNQSFSFTVLNGSLVTSIDTDPPQYYSYDTEHNDFYVFNGRTFTALQDPYTSETQFIKLGPDGHLFLYQWEASDWKHGEFLTPDLGNCGYPMVCGRYSICTNNGQCNCPVEGNFFRPINRNPDLGCSQITSISCNSFQYHSLIELKETTYFAFETYIKPSSSIWFEGAKLEDCKTACLSDCSCKAVVWSGTLRKNCLLLNEVFSLMDNWARSDKTTVFLKADEEDVHLLSVFRRKAEQDQLMDMVDKNNEDMQIHKQAATELMILAAWCVQDDFTKRPSMTLVVKVLEGLVSVETNIDYDFTSLPEVGAGNQQREATISSVLPSVLSGPRDFSWLCAVQSQVDEEDVHLLSVFRRKAEQDQLMDMVEKNDEDMQIHKQTATELMIPWCVQDDFTKRSSMTLVVKVLEGLVTVETKLGYHFTNIPEVGVGNQQREATISSVLPSVLSGPRNHPVKANATLQLGQDGNLVLTDSVDIVWSTNTTGKSVSGLNLTDMGNLVLFDKSDHTIWQSFDHPTDCLVRGQNLVSGQLTASISAANYSQDPNSPYLRLDGQTLTSLQYPPTSTPQFMNLEPDGHFKVYQWDVIYWKEVSDVLILDLWNCAFPMVCGRYSICSYEGQCRCPVEGNSFFRPFKDREPDQGCTELTPNSCDSSQNHSLLEIKHTTYFALRFTLESRLIMLEGTKLEHCQKACLSNCSCKAVVFNGRRKCWFLNEVFSLMDDGEGSDMTVFL